MSVDDVAASLGVRQVSGAEFEIAQTVPPDNDDMQCHSSDPVEWDVNIDIMQYYAVHIPSQNLDADFSKSGRQFGDKKRFVQEEYFSRHLTNGEIVTRDWLIYSPSKGRVFCYVCRLFSNDQPSQFITGFDDWKNAIVRMPLSEYHRMSIQKITSVQSLTNRSILKTIELTKSLKMSDKRHFHTGLRF